MVYTSIVEFPVFHTSTRQLFRKERNESEKNGR